MHIEVPNRFYVYDDKYGREWDYVSLYIDCDNEFVMEETPQRWFSYVVSRWATVSGSQYGRSMSTAIALPDGRTMQVVTRTLREAGEKYVDPPMIAVGGRHPRRYPALCWRRHDRRYGIRREAG
jgi:hypothetical protein